MNGSYLLAYSFVYGGSGRGSLTARQWVLAGTANHVSIHHQKEREMVKQDWHRVDIIAALHKKRLSLASLGRANGLGNETLINALNHAWPRGELIIANALNTTPSEIWPSRNFEPDGTPIKRTIRKPPITI